MTRPRPIQPIATAILILALAAIPADGAPLQRQADVEQSFAVEDGGRLDVEIAFGHIEVRSGDDGRVEVIVRREVRDRYEDDADRILSEFEVELEQTADGVRVRGRVGDDARDRWRDDYRNTPLRVEVEVLVPRRYDAELETSGGHIDVEDLVGEVRAETAGGHIDLGRIDGTVWADTSGGHVTLRGSTGSARLRTSGGHIEIGEVDGRIDARTSGGHVSVARAGGELEIETSGGRIEVDEVRGSINAHTAGGSIEARITDQPQGDSSLSTSGGSVTVYLAEGVAVDLDASAPGGVDLDVPVQGRVRRGSVEGTINGGGPRLRLRTSGGSVRIRGM